MTLRNSFYPWPRSLSLSSSSWLRNERKNRWKESWFPITGTHRALNEILTPCWNPSCLTIVSFVHFYSSYRKLKRNVFRAITISDLIQNLNYSSVLYTSHFNTHIFSPRAGMNQSQHSMIHDYIRKASSHPSIFTVQAQCLTINVWNEVIYFQLPHSWKCLFKHSFLLWAQLFVSYYSSRAKFQEQ